jgi:hypothetical protein
MEARIARPEADFSHMSRDVGRFESGMAHVAANLQHVRERQERDFRLLFGAIISVALGLGAVLAKGFGWLPQLIAVVRP